MKCDKCHVRPWGGEEALVHKFTIVLCDKCVDGVLKLLKMAGVQVEQER